MKQLDADVAPRAQLNLKDAFFQVATSNPAAAFSGDTVITDFPGKKIYVGNLPYSATDQSLNEAFANHGGVTSARIIMDRDSGRSKGFGFVEMSTGAEAQPWTGRRTVGRS